MMTWYAGSPAQLVRTLVTSMTLTVPSLETMRASPCSTNWPSSLSWAMRSMVSTMSLGWTKSVIGRPRWSVIEPPPASLTAARLP